MPRLLRTAASACQCSRFWIIALVVLVAFQIASHLLDESNNDTTNLVQTRIEDAYRLARRESLGFMMDVPDSEWILQKKKMHDMYPNVKGDLSRLLQQTSPISASVFFQEHYEPDFTCRHEKRLGVLGDGGKWVCDPYRLPSSNCLVYSVGSNGETSFEAAIRKTAPQCEIHTFDMEPRYRGAVEQAGAHFHAWGITSTTSANPFDKQRFKTLKETMSELGHTGRTIDIFKIDCEGCEWAVAPSLVEADLRQILIELHSVRHGTDCKMTMPTTVQFFDLMYKHGYVIFHKEPNIQYWHYLECIEYGFLKLHKDFFPSSVTSDNANAVHS